MVKASIMSFHQDSYSTFRGVLLKQDKDDKERLKW
jgi:hypothetical protein